MQSRKLRSLNAQSQEGFTVVELLIALVLAVIVIVIFITMLRTNLVQYLNVQKDGSTATNLAAQEARVANVIRGSTGVISATNNDLVLYSYFYPSDANVSKLHYYISGEQLLADLTPMSANPPTGTPLTAQLKTYVIIPNFYQASGTNLFAYYDASGSVLSSPVSEVNAIKVVQVNLAATATNGGVQSMNLQVDLRNFKTNL